MVVDIKTDLSKLTTVDKLYIDRLFSKIVWCVNDYVEQAVLSGEDTIDISLGFGTLTIHIEGDTIKYRFKPSSELESSVINTLINGRNELTVVLEKNLVQKLTNIYKDMF